MSLLLADLQAVAGGAASARDVARLRRDAETGPLRALTPVAVRALALTDHLCWDSLSRGDVPAFTRQCVIGGELREFCVCAGLLPEG